MSGGRGYAAIALGVLLATGAAGNAGLARGAATDPSTITVPYLGTADLTLNAAWTLAQCPSLGIALVEVSCDEDGGVHLTATGFEPDAGAWDLAVEVTASDGAPRVIDYRVVLEDPQPAQIRSGQLDWPGVAGGRTLIPIASLIESCEYCGHGTEAQVQVIAEEGDPTIRAWVTERHLVIDAAPEAEVATLAFRVKDSAGNWSEAGEIRVPLLRPSDSRDTALHLVVPTDATVGALELLAVADPSAWDLVGCTAASAGELSCELGAITFQPDPSDQPDQPGQPDLQAQVVVTMRSANGDTLTGSITFDASAEQGSRLAPAVPLDKAIQHLAFPAPPSKGDAASHSNAGLLAPLWQLLPTIT